MGIGLRTRDVYLRSVNIVDKVTGIVETSRTILGRGESARATENGNV